MELKDLKYTDTEKTERVKRYADGPTASYSGPDYPWGLSINLDRDTLTKLGMTTLPNNGEEMVMIARVKVTSVRAESVTENGEEKIDRSVGLQIVAAEFKPAEKPDQPPTTAVLYGGDQPKAS